MKELKKVKKKNGDDPRKGEKSTDGVQGSERSYFPMEEKKNFQTTTACADFGRLRKTYETDGSRSYVRQREWLKQKTND